MTDMPEDASMPHSRRMAVREKGGKWAPHAVRLRVLRSALFGDTQSKFARRLNAGIQQYSNIENGFPLSIDIANRIRLAAPGVTLDWLYHGDERAIPLDMLTKLRDEARKSEHQPPA